MDISAVLKLATASATLTDITAGSVSGNVQCWGDALRNDSTQDYDYNDFTLVFGYQTTTTVGACSAINIYKKTGDTYSSTPLKVTELQNLAVGDKLMIYSRSSLANSGARFRVTVNGSAGEWVTGAIDGNDKTVHSYAYTISTAGTYVFEGQVTTTAQ